MMPNYILCKRATGRYCHIGYPEGLRCINCQPWNDGESFILGDSGGDEWVVFPSSLRTGDSHAPSATVYPKTGFAYKKVT